MDLKKNIPMLKTTEQIQIKPSKGWVSLNLKEIWKFRELLYFLTWRDIKVRYKQTAIGVMWVLLQPLFTMLLFSLIFGRLAKIPSDGIPYPAFIFSGLLPWLLFAKALTDASTSLVSNEQIITKVYFPRVIVPTSAVLAGVMDFLIASCLLLGLLLFYGIVPNWNILALPFFVLMTILCALGVGFWLCALDVVYRDVRYTIPFLTQLWFFGTPIVYPSSLIPDQWKLLFGMNPMAGVIEGFRWSLLGKEDFPFLIILSSSITVIFLFTTGLYYFRRMEKNFSDII